MARPEKLKSKKKQGQWRPRPPVPKSKKKRGNKSKWDPKPKGKAAPKNKLTPKPFTLQQKLALAAFGQPLAKPGQVRITCALPKMNLIAQLAPEPPIFTGGFEGWEVIPRPRTDSVTVWQGNTSMQLTFTIVLDGFRGHVSVGESQEQKIRDLIRVARGGTKDRPGIIAIQGIAGTIFNEWVIENLEFGDQIRRPTDTHRIRQFITITLRQYEPPEFKRVRRGALKPPRRKIIQYKIKKGDTPVKIAKRHNTTWKTLKKLNPKYIKKPRQKLQVGRKINVPARINPKVKGK